VQVVHRVVVGQNAPCLRDIAGCDGSLHTSGQLDSELRHGGEMAEGGGWHCRLWVVPANDLGDVVGQPAHPVSRGRDLYRGNHHAQVPGHRRLQRQQRERTVDHPIPQPVESFQIDKHLLDPLRIRFDESCVGALD
jgi:hypothetical protein